MNGQTNLGNIIALLRRQAGLTQADLAQKLGITAQAVSQWERGETMPDIMTLPVLAEVFGCSIDALYKGESEEQAEAPASGSASGSVPEDGQWRAVVMCGSRIVETADLPETVKAAAESLTLTISGSVSGGLHSAFPVKVEQDLLGEVHCGALTVGGSITGDVKKSGAIAVRGDVSGSVSGGGGVSVGGSVGGNAHANGGLSVGRNVDGGASAEGGLTVGGQLQGDARAGGSITVKGGVTGSLSAGGEIRVEGDVGGDVHGENSVTVGGTVRGDAVGLNKGEPEKGAESIRESVSRFVGSVLDSVKVTFQGGEKVPDPSQWETAEEGEYQAVLMRNGVVVESQIIPGQGERVLLHIDGDAETIHSMFSVAVGGSVDGDIIAHTVTVDSDVNGDVKAEGDVTVGGDLNGDVDCGDLTVEGDINGDVDCGSLTVGGDIDGDVDCGSLTVDGDIDGDVDCGTLTVGGSIGGNVDCGDAKIGGSVEGDIDARSVTVQGDVDGDITAETVTVGGSAHGDIE